MNESTELIGEVTIEESQRLLFVYERQKAIMELLNFNAKDIEDIREALLREVQELSGKINEWWTEIRVKYNWQNFEQNRLFHSFDSYEVRYYKN
jgi:CXXX repeat modification system protein